MLGFVSVPLWLSVLQHIIFEAQAADEVHTHTHIHILTMV